VFAGDIDLTLFSIIIIPDMILPNGIIFQDLDIASAVMEVSTLLPKVTNQKLSLSGTGQLVPIVRIYDFVKLAHHLPHA
jgi:hypothetical protein